MTFDSFDDQEETWVSRENEWKLAKVLEPSDTFSPTVTLQLVGEPGEVNAELSVAKLDRLGQKSVHKANMWQHECVDLAALSHLNEPSMLHLVRSRYEGGNIYTRAGPVLVAVNPFKDVSGRLYTDDLLRQYHSASVEGRAAESFGGSSEHQLPPHVYAVAAAAYQAVRAAKLQSIIINGESGSGKTETVKIMLRFLTTAASSVTRAPAAPGGSDVGELISSRLLASSPALEAFGNAKTARNDNSSRFGKFVRLHFTAPGALACELLRV